MEPMLDVEDIRVLLPHRFPMLLVDRVLELQPGERVVALKNVTINEPFFVGHFPAKAVMPGVLIIEAMAQVAGLMLLSLPDHEEKLAYIAEVERFRFRRQVVPGDTLVTEARIVWFRKNMGKVRMTSRVGDALAAEGELKFALQPAPTESARAKLESVRAALLSHGGHDHSNVKQIAQHHDTVGAGTRGNGND